MEAEGSSRAWLQIWRQSWTWSLATSRHLAWQEAVLKVLSRRVSRREEWTEETRRQEIKIWTLNILSAGLSGDD